jgi:UrcA family protein
MKTTVLYAGACCFLGIAAYCAPASEAHANSDAPLTKVVRFADLDIQNPAGAEVLYRRIRSAAEEVCPSPPEPGHIVAQHACVKHAIDQAILSLHSAALSRLRFGSDFRLASK